MLSNYSCKKFDIKKDRHDSDIFSTLSQKEENRKEWNKIEQHRENLVSNINGYFKSMPKDYQEILTLKKLSKENESIQIFKNNQINSMSNLQNNNLRRISQQKNITSKIQTVRKRTEKQKYDQNVFLLKNSKN